MGAASPNKRRALAPLDANTRSPLGTPRLSPSKLGLPKSNLATSTSLVESTPIKRLIGWENDRTTLFPAKKRRLSNPSTEPVSLQNEMSLQKVAGSVHPCTPRPRSISPEGSSVFDSSTIANSQNTAPSEPDVGTTTEPATAENQPRQRSMTREEARRKAEILRLRLGLASYKVRTNQADVPLEKLQARRVPGRFLPRRLSTVSPPPLQASSPGHGTAVSQRDEGKRQGPPTRYKGPSSRTAMSLSPSYGRGESGSPASQAANMNRSPIRKRDAAQTLPATVLNTPQRKPSERDTERDDELSDNERGGAEGLLSLSQSSPASTLK